MPVKVNLTSLDLKEEKIQELKNILPEIFTENKIDWEKLKHALGENIEKGVEKFGFMWNGKANAVNSVLIPSKLTLKPVKQDSIRFDESENLIIEGDNLEVLKLLQKAYFQRVKMIYIDPPYNTGGDFVYKDDFKAPLQGYLKQTGQTGENGDSLTTNKETNGRFHSSWLSMMYPRLKLAWNLLRDDGVIFISIDDNEVHRLRIMMDEIFGEENFVIEFAWRKSDNQANIGNVARVKEYIVCYTKDNQKLKLNKMKLTERARKEYRYSDKKGKFRRAILLHKTRGRHFYNITTPSGKVLNGPWMIKKEQFDGLAMDDGIYWTSGGDEQPYGKIYIEESQGQIANDFLNIEYGTNQQASLEFEKIFSARYFDFPKPVSLIKHFITISTSNNEVILDFFAGSGTTAQAVLELNKEDKGNRKFVLVQLPELTPKDSEAYKAGYKTIADICKERVRRVINGYGDKPEPLQDGFKVFKLDKSNYVENNFEYDPQKTEEENQANFITYLQKAKQTSLFESGDPIDIVYENIVKEGLSLNSKVAKTSIDGNEVYKVEDNESGLKFYISLDKQISKETIKELLTEQYKDNTFISLDSALNDSDKANLGLHLTLKTI